MYRHIDELLEKVDNRFTLTMLAAKRARDINTYLNSLKRGELAQVPGPQLEMATEKPLTIAFAEIAAGKISYEQRDAGIK